MLFKKMSSLINIYPYTIALNGANPYVSVYPLSKARIMKSVEYENFKENKL